MQIKPGVSIKGLRPEILLGVQICDRVFKEFNLTLVITEVTGGAHGFGSLHYVGLAVDFRCRHIPNDMKHLVLQTCRDRLWNEFDFILEDEGEDNEHFHLEYQPKH